MICFGVIFSMLFTGCSPIARFKQRFSANKDHIFYVSDDHKPLDYYKDYATSIEYPTENCPIESDVPGVEGPQTLDHNQHLTPWDLTLEQVLHLALANNEILRDALQFRSGGNSILANPNNTPSSFDIEILESGVLFGSRGVQAALADFDTRWVTQMTWGRNEDIQNTPFFGVGGGNELYEDTGAFSTRVEKTFANSGSVAVEHQWNYSQNNVNNNLGVGQLGRLFPSAYTGSLTATYRQPLLAGRGTEFTRIAGPISNSLTGVSGVSQGVMISRINTDISLADVELNLANLVKGVEDLYWDLYLTYMTYQAEIDAMQDSVRNLNRVRARDDDSVVIYQAENAYERAKSRVQNSLADVYDTEARLRRTMGLQVNNGRIIRPSDPPSVASFQPDWTTSLAEALTRRVELRRQKWNIKSLELQLKAARSLVKPRFDFVSNYSVNGFGDHLLADQDDTRPFNSAYETLTNGNQTAWNFGFELNAPIGFRSAKAQVRNYESRLAKARKVLGAQEMEISHELAQSWRDMGRWRETAKTLLQRQETARLTIDAFEARMEGDSAARQQAEAIDFLLRAREQLRDDRIAYYRSVVEYNKSITDLQYRKGILLDYNNIFLEEGRWCHAAYDDALRRAYERTYAKENTKLHSEPMGVISRYGHPDMQTEPVYEMPVGKDASVRIPQDTPAPPNGPILPDSDKLSTDADESAESESESDEDDSTNDTDTNGDGMQTFEDTDTDEEEPDSDAPELDLPVPTPVDDAQAPKLSPTPVNVPPKRSTPPVANPYPPVEGRVVEIELKPETTGRVKLMSLGPIRNQPRRFVPSPSSRLRRTPLDGSLQRKPTGKSRLRPTPVYSVPSVTLPVPKNGIQQVQHTEPATGANKQTSKKTSKKTSKQPSKQPTYPAVGKASFGKKKTADKPVKTKPVKILWDDID